MTSTGTMPDSVGATAKPPLLTFCIMAFADYAVIDDVRMIIHDHLPSLPVRRFRIFSTRLYSPGQGSTVSGNGMGGRLKAYLLIQPDPLIQPDRSRSRLFRSYEPVERVDHCHH